jgi:L-lactate utilization protein LutC
MSFLSDDAARNAYLAGEPAALHDRLEVMGIEEQIKEYYRPQISDEAKLDQHIHQILYDRTGYVGAQYEVNPEGVLVLKDR